MLFLHFYLLFIVCGIKQWKASIKACTGLGDVCFISSGQIFDNIEIMRVLFFFLWNFFLSGPTWSTFNICFMFSSSAFACLINNYYVGERFVFCTSNVMKVYEYNSFRWLLRQIIIIISIACLSDKHKVFFHISFIFILNIKNR